MIPSLRKLALTAHVTISVGWLGAVGGFLALALAGLTSESDQIVRAAYLAMELTGWFVIVPLCLASLPTGLVMSLGTEWGLFRHWWVVAKLFISVVATLLLLVHMQPVGHLARVVAETTLAQGELAGIRVQLVADAGAALVALLAATVLSIYKPRGLTPYGRRRAAAALTGSTGSTGSTSAASPAISTARWVRAVAVLLAILALLFVIRHLGGGMAGH
jgi:hypothetical protein